MKNYVKTIARKREFGIVIMVFVLATLLTCMSDAFCNGIILKISFVVMR